ncbi:putative syntaxin-5, Sly1p-binding domain-containing protein [Rosa chinensis]|uniref:Putative syntaxin-5, Sly1p-binding domain-containing protein n=1 Tax=Rosa chinensis TaxID=74649 RepID=A0A2P6SL57_ROSCH|nr:syntaxin-31 [Rosa chinensis]PRQ59399.1 putative syntaxin-5, Sly1p-binding domain-containing protein [Rosa chinensis]
MASTYRDRTSEFRSLSDTLQKIGGITPVNQSQNAHSPSRSPAPASSGSEFNKKASRIGSGIHETTLKISRLAQLAKRSSMFNDPTVEIQELTSLVKNDITSLDVALTDLQTIQNMEIADGKYSQDKVVHSTAVCDDLKGRLMGATKKLHDVLTTRTENIKAHENRKQIFSTNTARENPFKSPAKTVTEPPPWSTSSSASGSVQPSQSSTEVQVGNQLRRRLAVDNPPSQQMEMSMLQQVVPRQENYTESRATALQNVESTISELSGVFTHLATMVAHQGELAIRIDDNMDESLTNVEGAHSALLRNLNRISSNRWLIIKIFAILIFFLIVFIFFVA